MKTVEEAAMNFANYESNNLDKLPFKVKNVVDYDNGITRGFKAGAEWQSKQSLWTLIGDRENPMPNDKSCLLLLEDGSVVEDNSNWEDRYLLVVAWMLKPSFDEILEANKDVLQRLK